MICSIIMVSMLTTPFKTPSIKQQWRNCKDLLLNVISQHTDRKAWVNYPQVHGQILTGLSSTLPCRPAKGSLMRPPAWPPAPKPGRVASAVAGSVSKARPFCPPTEPAIFSGISRGWLRVLCWAIMPVIRVARPSWVRTLKEHRNIKKVTGLIFGRFIFW